VQVLRQKLRHLAYSPSTPNTCLAYSPSTPSEVSFCYRQNILLLILALQICIWFPNYRFWIWVLFKWWEFVEVWLQPGVRRTILSVLAKYANLNWAYMASTQNEIERTRRVRQMKLSVLGNFAEWNWAYLPSTLILQVRESDFLCIISEYAKWNLTYLAITPNEDQAVWDRDATFSDPPINVRYTQLRVLDEYTKWNWVYSVSMRNKTRHTGQVHGMRSNVLGEYVQSN